MDAKDIGEQIREIGVAVLEGMGLDPDAQMRGLEARRPWYEEEGDFRAPDGTLMSGKLPGQAKEARYAADDGSTVVFPVLTPQQASALNRRRETPAERNLRIRANRERCFAGEFRELEECRFEQAAPDTDPALLQDVEKYAAQFPENREKKLGRGLILYGPVGRGKTFIAACLCNALVDAGWRCKMTSTRAVRSQAESRFGSAEEAIAALCRNDLVVLDDFWRDRDTEWGRELVFDVVDALYKLRVPTVVTTNMSEQAIYSPGAQDQPVMDRLKERCSRIHVQGPNRRQVRAYGL